MYEYRAKVLKVIDGDTIDVIIDLGFAVKFVSRLRLYGINSSEIRTKDKIEKAKGLAAKARLKVLIEGKDVTVNTFKDKAEKFGRMLANITIDGRVINDQLISEGHAVSYFGDKR